MNTFTGRLSLAFGAGCLGGLVNSVAVWFFGDVGITARFGVSLAPALTPAWLYPRIVWGGIWGVVLLFPVIRSSHLLRGLVLSLLPSAVSLFIVLPSAEKGFMGTQMGLLTPFFTVFFNALWGITAGLWYALASGQARRF